jgi:hypothetical protein
LLVVLVLLDQRSLCQKRRCVDEASTVAGKGGMEE